MADERKHTIARRAKALLAPALLRLFLLPAPQVRMDAAKRDEFDHILRSAVARGPNSLIEYNSRHPRHEFLRYLTRGKGLLLHGSSNPDITELEPRQQGDFEDKPVTAVFASGDGIWPMFFAIVNRANYRGSIRNACIVVHGPDGRTRRFYYFSINAAMWDHHPWREGTIHILPRATFRPTDTGLVRYDEWASEQPVRPLAKLRIAPDDFPFLRNVTGHNEQESEYVTWLLHKPRLMRG